MTSRSLIQRICVVLGLVALSAYLFYTGKGHTLLLDTNAVTIGDQELSSYVSAIVSVDGKELNSPMGRAERAMLTVSGPKHKIVIVDEVDTNNKKEVDTNNKKVERTFMIPTFMERVIVSIPAILGDAPVEYWVIPFTPPSVENASVEKMQYQKD
ncbi:MAG: hypothetical protein LBJ36_11960 [Synergistaceae bacterium]|jgi:hypothetical protein|nr:hypothetical protein [Synergistaceae bacterium]